MATGIEWTDDTWNPLRGCSRISEGCRNCYAETTARRFGAPGRPYEGVSQWDGTIKESPEHVWYYPTKWTRPRKIFVNSMSDLFHENVPEETIDRIFDIMIDADIHTFQILTKRPVRMQKYMSSRTAPSNVWLGVSVENQDVADERIPLLLETNAALRFLSCEPLLGPVDLRRCNSFRSENPVQWVICGGESGNSARPMETEWAESLQQQCEAHFVPFFFKQWGEHVPFDQLVKEKQEEVVASGRYVMDDSTMSRPIRIGKRHTGALLHGKEYKEFPE